MPAPVLISGSVAYDTIMVFDGHFQDHILPDRVHMLNVSFLAPTLKREFGGCAANIAYNLALLGGQAVVLAAVGRDGSDYVERLSALGIDTSCILQSDSTYTAQAFITTDLADNQITAFHPGAMMQAHEVALPDTGQAAWGIVAPNGKEAMLRHARDFAARQIPWIFDPGQALPLFSGDELRALIQGAQAIAVNDYESQLLAQKTGWDETRLAREVQALIVTRGSQGSVVYHEGSATAITPVRVLAAVDPTGCGDAFRGGLLHGLASGLSWANAARLGSVMGAIKVEHSGPQNHRPTRDQVELRFREAYGHRPW